MESKRICVYCASSTQLAPEYLQAARELGTLMARQGITLINGAGSTGLMAASADGCLEHGGTAIGVIPSFMIEEGWCHKGMSRIIETTDIHARQSLMAEMSDAAIVLPGGCGTFAEVTELITWKQLGLYLKPIVLLNQDGYYDAFLSLLDRAVKEHFMRAEHAFIWRVAQSPQEAIDLALHTPMWDKDIRRFATI